jgi:hypothetical protein
MENVANISGRRSWDGPNDCTDIGDSGILRASISALIQFTDPSFLPASYAPNAKSVKLYGILLFPSELASREQLFSCSWGEAVS